MIEDERRKGEGEKFKKRLLTTVIATAYTVPGTAVAGEWQFADGRKLTEDPEIKKPMVAQAISQAGGRQ